MENDFFKVAYVVPKYGQELKYKIEEDFDGDLLGYLAKIYAEDPSSFIEYSDFAFISLGLHDFDGKTLYAFFTQNRNPGRQPWFLSDIKTEEDIGELCGPSVSSTDNDDGVEKISRGKRRIVQNVVTVFEDKSLRATTSVKTLIEKYRKEHSGGGEKDGVVFERMLIQAIIENDFPNSINNDESLLDAICVDDYYDSGIDGICIRVNGHIVTNKRLLDFIIASDKGIRSAEIILIQSKCKDTFDLKEISVFIMGIQNFLDRESTRKLNPKVQAWFDIKNDILARPEDWTEMTRIEVRPFYVAANAKWTDSSEVLGSFETLRKAAERIENGIYSISKPVFMDEDRVVRLSANENDSFSVRIKLNGTPLQLAGDESVMGCAAIINADELLKILIDETTGNLKRGLFEENVRDYQGNTGVNLSIKETIRTAPESFILRNNGITILSNRLEIPNYDSVRITNPQIVNGCQTCSVIYYAHKEGLDISKVKVFARIISTNDSETINSIVSANNNQNMVHDMINEITKAYHKRLEVFFRNFEDTSEQRHVYYERRSKSLVGENICAYQKCSFKTLLQSAVAVWFDSPFDAMASEYQLLPQYRDRVFSDNHSEICYYASASLYSAFERLIYQGKLDSKFRSAKSYACYLVKDSLGHGTVSMNDIQKSVSLSQSILSLCKRDGELEDAFNDALLVFEKAEDLFEKTNNGKRMGNFLSSQKIMSYMREAKKALGVRTEEKGDENKAVTYSGSIARIDRDRYGRYYLFINRSSGIVFAHESYSKSVSFSRLQKGQNVVYELGPDANGKEVAKNVHP